jgi:hypothetical protein
MHAIITSTSRRHSCSAVPSLGLPSTMLISKAVVLSISGNHLSSLDLSRTRTLSLCSRGSCTIRQRRIADPVEPVAPSRAYTGIFKMFDGVVGRHVYCDLSLTLNLTRSHFVYLGWKIFMRCMTRISVVRSLLRMRGSCGHGNIYHSCTL